MASICSAVEFLVPDTSAKYDLIDSLYTCMTKLETQIQTLEKSVIKDPSVRKDDLNTKLDYLKYLKEYQLCPENKIQTCKELYKDYLNCRMTYFQELLTVLQDDSRAHCFALFRKSRDELAIFNRY